MGVRGSPPCPAVAAPGHPRALADGSGEHQTLYTYDTRHRLTGITQQLCTVSAGHACSATVATASNTYEYDDADNRTTVVEHNGAASTDRRYCYDARGQLLYRNTGAACSAGANDEAFSYDDTGNRLTATEGGVTRTFAYTPEGALCDVETAPTAASCTGGNVSTDSAGRITAYGGWWYGYDAEGRMVTACRSATCAAGSDKLEFTYDGEGNRTKITETPASGSPVTREFRYQGGAVVQEKRDGVVVRDYVVGSAGTIGKVIIPAGQADAGTYLPVWNGHGDLASLWRMNADGTLTLANSVSYGTWGTSTLATHNGIGDLAFRYRYVGAADVQSDDSYGAGLLYMHARHYSPTFGRFLQPDPARAEANLYGYAGNNPVTRVDPSGTCALLCVVLVGVILFGGLGAAVEVAKYMMIEPRDEWRAERFAEVAARGFFEYGTYGLVPISWFAVARAAAFGKVLPRWYFKLGVHSYERMAKYEVTRQMIAKTLQRGTQYWDPLNRTVSFVLRGGMASGDDILVARNPLTGKITTVMTGDDVVRPRFIPIR